MKQHLHLRPNRDSRWPASRWPCPAGRDPAFDDPATPADESLTTHFKSKMISYAFQQGLVEGSQFIPNDENERYR